MMDRNYFQDEKFEKANFLKDPLVIADYENCSFVNCEMSKAVLSGIRFVECEFNGCNLSVAKLDNTAFKDVVFKECKLLGLHFQDCDQFLFSASFDNCAMNISSFVNMKLKKMRFSKSILTEADFTGADLSGAVFDKCDLGAAIFQHTIMENADFSTSFNYSFDPELNKLKKTKFSLNGIKGLLDKYDIEIVD